jgi:hypothetical protein
MSDVKPQKICAWITRHHPTPWQARDLREAGYTIVYIPTREIIAYRILAHIEKELRQNPTIIVAAHPADTLHHLAHLAPCPVLIADMDHSYQKAKWRGTWKRVIRNQLITRPFKHKEQ